MDDLFTQLLMQIFDPAMAWPQRLWLFAATVFGLCYLVLGKKFAPNTGAVEKIWGVVVSSVLLIWLIVSALVYLFWPFFYDHGRSIIVTISGVWRKGGDIYPNVYEGKHVYGSLYGPLIFQINGIAMSAMHGVVGMKIIGVFTFLFSLFLLFWANKQYLFLKSFLYLKVASFFLIIGSIYPVEYLFWNGTEPLLLFCAALSVCALSLRRKNVAALSIGLLAGLSVNLKIHGIFYILPQAIALLFMLPREQRIYHFFLGLGAFTIAFILPQLDPQVDFKNRLEIMKIFTLWLEWSLLGENILLGLALLMLAGYPRTSHSAHFYALTLCLVFVCVLASKIGSGTWHLMPFAPTVLYLSLRQKKTVQEDNTLSRSDRAFFYTVLIVFLQIRVLDVNRFGLPTMLANPNMMQEATAELRGLRQQFPDAEMGITNENSFHYLYKLRALAPQHNIPALDIGAWFDLKMGGVPESLLKKQLYGCKIPVWIMPSEGDPFSMHNPYNYDEMLFSKNFVETFKAHYKLHSKRKYFSVWQCVEKP